MMPEIDNERIAQKIITTNFKNNREVLDYFTKSNMYYSYLEIVEAFDISFEPEVIIDKKVKFPQKITYINYPKVDFFPYTLPKTKVIQIWDKKDNTFVGDIITDYLHIKISILPFIENGIKLLFVAEIIKKEFFISSKILNFILCDFERIFKIIRSDYIHKLN